MHPWHKLAATEILLPVQYLLYRQTQTAPGKGSKFDSGKFKIISLVLFQEPQWRQDHTRLHCGPVFQACQKLDE